MTGTTVCIFTHFDFSIYLREQVKKIGDVMQKFAPFLKMYTEYIQNFDQAMTTFDTWVEKSARFANIVDEVQVGQLTKNNNFIMLNNLLLNLML